MVFLPYTVSQIGVKHHCPYRLKHAQAVMFSPVSYVSKHACPACMSEQYRLHAAQGMGSREHGQ